MKRKGFTLIELLLVIGIIAILASIVIVAINPQRQLAAARNAQRQSDVNTLLNAMYQYIIDEEELPTCLRTSADGGTYVAGTVLGICEEATCLTTDTPAASANYAEGTGNTNTAGSCALVNDLVTGTATKPSYMGDLPEDPQDIAGAANYIGYNVSMANDRITVIAPFAEDGETIQSTR